MSPMYRVLSADIFASSGGLDGVAETVVYVLVAMVVLRLQLLRRANLEASESSVLTGGKVKGALRQGAPEMAGLVAVASLVVAILWRGDVSGNNSPQWLEIKQQWPTLMCADTLLAMQAMLRVVVLLSVVLRSSSSVISPLADETAAFWLAAAVARVAMGMLSTAYNYDGPLGGGLSTACEIAVIPLLYVLSGRCLRRVPLILFAVVLGSGWFAFRHHLNLAEDRYVDALFTFAHCLDALAAFSYFLRTVLIENCQRLGCERVSIGFAHLLMPAQQGLAAYYFHMVFSGFPGAVGAGLPVEILVTTNVMQLVAYVGAAMLFVTDWIDGDRAAAPAVPARPVF